MLIEFNDMFCTLEQAKKLKSLGIIQSSHFYYIAVMEDYYIYKKTELNFDDIESDECFSAFSVAELGIIICDTEYKNGNLVKLPHCYQGNWYHETNGFKDPKTSEAVARADLLIKLISECHLTVEEINARLK